jgi:geranylgeranyl reductase family protein
MVLHDCLVIGAGPAGATAAYHLARLGRKVLLLDKARLPRVKPCGGGVSPQVAQWLPFDLSPAISAKVTTLRFTWEMDSPVEGDLGTGEPLWMVRRDRFDQLLADQAVAQGCELQDATEVTGLRWQSDRWLAETSTELVSGRYLVAADGALGKTARRLGFLQSKHLLAGALEGEAACGMADTRTAHLDFGSIPNGYLWAFPKAEGWSMGVGIFRGKQNRDLRATLGGYAHHFGIDPGHLMLAGHPIRLWDGNQMLHTQQALLAGEAACLADPFTAEGIRPSILSGLRAAQSVHAALSGQDRALEDYTRRIQEEWGAEMVWARRLARLFYRIPSAAYQFAVQQPGAVQRMAQLLCGELRYSEVARRAMTRITQGALNLR